MKTREPSLLGTLVCAVLAITVGVFAFRFLHNFFYKA
jgi:hypothetical protein